jgi:DNA invertase Pin-like site-specific DNA recombinase
MASGKLVAYYRVSTVKQGQSGLGEEAQRAAVRQFLDGTSGELVAEYREVESGKRSDRPELAKAIAHAKRARATLVIAKLDRLARNLHFITGLQESGIEFVAADNPHANEFTIHILAAVAQHEAKAISRRTKEALAAAKARGVVLGKPENLTAAAREASIKARREKVRRAYAPLERLIVDLRGRGMSFQAIAAHLNELGEVTRNGAAFTATTVKRIVDRAA